MNSWDYPYSHLPDPYSNLPDLPGRLLARELEARAAKIDPALCRGPGMMYADKAVLCEAARRLYEHHSGRSEKAPSPTLLAAIERCRSRQPLAEPPMLPEVP